MKKIRYLPFGYTIRNGHTVIEQQEADVVRNIFRSYIQGASLKEIAEDLTAKKIPYTDVYKRQKYNQQDNRLVCSRKQFHHLAA